MTETTPECPSPREKQQKFTCVTCPNSCRLTVWTDPGSTEVHVEGNTCPRGKDYGINEYTNPVRMIITTMRIEGGILPVIPVRSKLTIPKAKIKEVFAIINKAVCQAPVTMGQVLISNIANTGVDIIASRDIKKSDH
jgi:CxxC motif-containing protein